MVNKEFFQALDVLEKEKKISREKLIEALKKKREKPVRLS